jgi:inner membrane protein
MTFRAVVVGILVLLLLIPMSMVQDLIYERQGRKGEVESEVGMTWGSAQTITGPVIDVPYEVPVQVPAADGTGRMETRTEIHYVHILPEELTVDLGLDPSNKHRGIYEVAVYSGHMKLQGAFAPISAARLRTNYRLKWDEATITLGVSDLRSIKEQVRMQIGGRTVDFEPGSPSTEVVSTGLSALFPLDSALQNTPLDYELDLRVNGSMSFSMVPVGKRTVLQCTSSWPDPSFNGAFLPDTSNVGPQGFQARWTVLHLNRPYPQEFIGDRSMEVMESAFGVALLQPVDEYQKNMRAAKYGVMLIVLVFLVFFFVEVLRKLRIHPIQYLLVGFALCMFYTLLIALSEHIGFGKAYIVSALAVIGLTVFYAASVFREGNATRLLGLVMVLVFGFMFSLIHQQDYALLFGSIGLFIVLALVMWVSRRIDWNGTKG